MDSRIDYLARDGRGQTVLVFEIEAGEDLSRLGNALAQRAWAAPRVADWMKLGPDLGLRAELGVRVLLLAPSFDPRTRLAARALGEAVISLAHLPGQTPRKTGRLVSKGHIRGEPRPQEERATTSHFRTGLRPIDL
jgi:hypothetical protein